MNDHQIDTTYQPLIFLLLDNAEKLKTKRNLKVYSVLDDTHGKHLRP